MKADLALGKLMNQTMKLHKIPFIADTVDSLFLHLALICMKLVYLLVYKMHDNDLQIFDFNHSCPANFLA